MGKASLEFTVTICGVKYKIFINENYVNNQNSVKSVPHDHLDYELHFIKTGELNEIINDKNANVKTGEILLIKPTEIHYRSRNNSHEFIDYNFRFLPIKPPENAKNSVKNNYRYCLDILNKITVIKASKYLINNFTNLQQELNDKKFGFIDNAKCFVAVILTDILREVDNGKIKESGYEFSGYSRNKIDEFFSLKFLTDVKIEDLASDLNLSVRQVNRIMLKYFNVSFKTRLTEMRLLESALRIKTTNDSIQKISVDCGFNYYVNFFNSFKKKYGVSPAEYRKNNR